MTTTSTVSLPGGFWVDGDHYREGVLRPLTGNEEAFLLEARDTLLPVQLTTVLLVRCLEGLGPLVPVTPKAVRSLTVGDREALLLHLRRLTLGNRLELVLECPAPRCGERMDIELQVDDLLLPPYPAVEPLHEATVRGEETTYLVHFRLPTGADQERAAALAHSDLNAATELLLGRCVERVIHGDGEDLSVDGFPSAVTEHIATVMADLDPQAELTMNVTCPSCGHAFPALFDTATFFFRELETSMSRLYWEVHMLAFHYHWSEAEILAMTSRKRHVYLGMLSDALTEAASR